MPTLFTWNTVLSLVNWIVLAQFPEPESQSWFEMFIESFQDATLIVLIVAAVVSFVVGLIEDPAKGWIEGAAILFAVLVVAVVTATNNFNKESQFRKLNAVKDDVKVGVLRNGVATTIDVKKLVSNKHCIYHQISLLTEIFSLLLNFRWLVIF